MDRNQRFHCKHCKVTSSERAFCVEEGPQHGEGCPRVGLSASSSSQRSEQHHSLVVLARRVSTRSHTRSQGSGITAALRRYIRVMWDTVRPLTPFMSDTVRTDMVRTLTPCTGVFTARMYRRLVAVACIVTVDKLDGGMVCSHDADKVFRWYNTPHNRSNDRPHRCTKCISTAIAAIFNEHFAGETDSRHLNLGPKGLFDGGSKESNWTFAKIEIAADDLGFTAGSRTRKRGVVGSSAELESLLIETLNLICENRAAHSAEDVSTAAWNGFLEHLANTTGAFKQFKYRALSKASGGSCSSRSGAGGSGGGLRALHQQQQQFHARLVKVKEEKNDAEEELIDAQELAENLVQSENNKMTEIDELKARIRARDARIAALEAQNAAKGARNAELEAEITRLHVENDLLRPSVGSGSGKDQGKDQGTGKRKRADVEEEGGGDDDDSWTCVSCTLNNPKDADTCSACDTQRFSRPCRHRAAKV